MKRSDLIKLAELDEEFGDGWWLGEHLGTGQKGLFPAGQSTHERRLQFLLKLTGSTGFTRKAELREYMNALHVNPPAQGIISPDKFESPAQIEPSTPVESSFARVDSGQTTPQASRQTSLVEAHTPGSPPGPHRSASSPLPQTNLAADIQQAFRTPDGHTNGEESPVMNETLSVIDEHITDMNTPRHSLSTQDAKTINDSGSEYSSHISHRISYINGHETDEEEGTHPSEAQVRRWNQTETSKHLRALGIDSKHCDIFEEQEITGDVLLDMDQDFLFMKEFEFGVMGKRLKTWHKVKAFQEEVKGIKPQPVRSSVASSFAPPQDERSLSRASHAAPFLPRIPSVTERTGSAFSHRGPSAVSGQHPRLASNNSSPITPGTPQFGDSRRVSAASIRELNHSRRHSSIDSTHGGISNITANSNQTRPSFDRTWTLNGGNHPSSTQRPGTTIGTPMEGIRSFRPNAGSEPPTPDGIDDDDLDRGYFSGTEAETRRNRRVLHKRASASHSRNSSYADDSFTVHPSFKRQSRIASVDSLRDVGDPASSKTNGTPPKSRLRSLSTRANSDQAGRTSQSSNPDSRAGFFSSLGPLIRRGDSESGRSSHFQPLKSVGPKMRRAVGLRTMSEQTTKDSNTSAPVSPREYDPASGRTGSTTPSATSKSSERHSTDGSGKAGDIPGFMVRPRTVKSKKETSAYTRGLEKKSPKEQMEGCHYSGWMKKRSSNLMTTWKPRLFVLRGRRLSYYYSEDDPEERGLIDITAHRVLRADNDPIIALHATVTGSTAQPATATASATTPSSPIKSKDASGPFFFKLVPPKSGNGATVQFTKPSTHYFQVDTVQEGRLWMAALMKATIEHMGESGPSTNKQRTISLKQAQLMNQRPPALMNLASDLGEPEKLAEEDEDNALRIEGLNLTKPPSSEGNFFVDAKDELEKPEVKPEVQPDAEPDTTRPLSNPEIGANTNNSDDAEPTTQAKHESK